MKIDEVQLYQLKMKMKHPFTASFGTEQEKLFNLVEVKNEDGFSGWGECVASYAPLYSEETTQSCWAILKEFLIPMILYQNLEHPDDVHEAFKVFHRNNMAKASIEGAIWDVYAKSKGISLASALGGVKETIDVGISLGIEDNIDDLLAHIQNHVKQGYKRIKVKIKPGKDIPIVREIRHHFPDLPLMIDANSAYTLNDVETLKELDPYHLMMIEQPLTAGDLIDHAKLQKQLQTPICLDESIQSYEDARQAIEIGSGKIINLKIGRVGGLTEAKKIHDLCEQESIPLWCGGMLESGIGRAHNIALTTLSNFTMPGDTASSSLYWDEDIIQPEVTVKDGTIEVPKSPGIGFQPDREAISNYTVNHQSFQ